MIRRLAVLVEHQLLTDVETDIQTHDDSIYRARIASCGKNPRWRTAAILKTCKNGHILVMA